MIGLINQNQDHRSKVIIGETKYFKSSSYHTHSASCYLNEIQVFEGSKCYFPSEEKEYNMLLFLLRAHTLSRFSLQYIWIQESSVNFTKLTNNDMYMQVYFVIKD